MICDKWLHIYGNKHGTGIKCEWVDDVRENVRGEWKIYCDDKGVVQGCYCDQCGFNSVIGGYFCPNCGADMRVGGYFCPNFGADMRGGNDD